MTDVRLWNFETYQWPSQQFLPGSRGATRDGSSGSSYIFLTLGHLLSCRRSSTPCPLANFLPEISEVSATLNVDSTSQNVSSTPDSTLQNHRVESFLQQPCTGTCSAVCYCKHSKGVTVSATPEALARVRHSVDALVVVDATPRLATSAVLVFLPRANPGIPRAEINRALSDFRTYSSWPSTGAVELQLPSELASAGFPTSPVVKVPRHCQCTNFVMGVFQTLTVFAERACTVLGSALHDCPGF